MSLFLISTVIGKALTFILWEFTHVITYNSAIYIRDIINITFKLLLHSQLVNIYSLSITIIVSPVWVTYLLIEVYSIPSLVTICIPLVVIFDICWPFYQTL